VKTVDVRMVDVKMVDAKMVDAKMVNMRTVDVRMADVKRPMARWSSRRETVSPCRSFLYLFFCMKRDSSRVVLLQCTRSFRAV